MPLLVFEYTRSRILSLGSLVYVEENADLTLPMTLSCFWKNFYLGFLLPLSLSYCIRNRLISEVMSASSLIRKVTQPELGNTW